MAWRWLLLHLLAIPAWGQDYLVSVQRYSVPEGLSHRNVRYVKQDRRGFIWVGTYSGLNRFDGFYFQRYMPEEYGFAAHDCVRIMEDRRGRLWLIYSRHPGPTVVADDAYLIDLFDPVDGTVTPLEKAFQVPFSRHDVIHHESDGSGNVYLLLRSGEVYRFDGDRFQRLLSANITGAGYLAITDHGVIGLLNGNRFTCYDSLGSLLHRTLLPEPAEIVRTAQGRFWGGKRRGETGLELWSIQSDRQAQPFYFRDGSGRSILLHWDHNFEAPIYPDRQGRWWVFAEGQLLLFDNNGKLLYDFTNDLRSHDFSLPVSITFDRRNTAWIATDRGLLSISLQKNPFSNYLTSESLSDTRGIVQDGQGRVHVVQSGKVWRLNDRTGAATDLDIPAWRAAARDAQGRLWFGEYGSQVFAYEPVSGEKKIYVPERKTGQDRYNATLALFPDSVTGRIWIGKEHSGLAYIDPDQAAILPFSAYNQFPHLRQAGVQCFLQDESGLWFGTRQGLYRLQADKGVVAEYSRRTGDLPYDNIQHVYKDQDGIFWLAAGGGGLIRWNPKTGDYRQFTEREGLSNDVIYAVYEDEFEQLWLPSNAGLMRFDKRDFQINTYLPRDGIPHEEFNFSSHYQAPDGRLYFGGLKGVTAFYSRTFSQKSAASDPLLGVSRYLELDGTTGAFVDKTKELLLQKRIRLGANHKSFQLSVVFADYRSPRDNRFAYRIEGWDDTWHYQSDNTFRINELPYGSFTLCIKAQGANGYWTESELRLPLTVVRPVYQRWWFLALALALAVAAVAWRLRSLRRAARRLELEVQKRTFQIEQDKRTIEQQAAELRQLDELKSRFFANMAHELRTPLTLILGPVKKLLRNGDLSKQTAGTLNLVQNNAHDLLRLAEDILDMDKLEARRLALREETVLFYPLLRRLVFTFESHAQSGGIDLHFDYQANQNLRISLDVNKFERILFNLISNALKFTGHGGTVSVSVRETADRLCLQVSDTGRGIHPEDLPHIFDRFYQARHQGNQAEGGAGIGLALAREYTRLLEGRLNVESRLNEGSAFLFEFPKKVVADEEERELSEGGSPSYDDADEAIGEGWSPVPISVDRKEDRGGKAPVSTQFPQAGANDRLLLVEDNGDMRHFLVDILSPLYTVAGASNGARALEWLSDAPATEEYRLPELIITDLMMPEMDGFTLIQRLKDNPAWQGIPVIALTARTGLDDRLSALRFGVDDYLTKPFEPAELLARVANLLRNYRRRREWLAAQPETDEENAYYLKIDPPEAIASADQQWLAELEALAMNNIGGSNFSVTELAYLLHLSERQLRRKLKDITGLSPSDYLNEIRLQRARQLLESRAHDTVAEVSYAVGLSTPKHFSRLYKARFGRLPSSYTSGKK